MKPRRSDSLRSGTSTASGSGRGQDVLAGLTEELHDIKRVRDFGQEEDLKEALGKMIERVEELSSLLSQAYKTHSELETQAKLAKSNLQMALANNEMLEDALRRESAAGSKNVGWRRRNDSQTDQPPPTTSEEGSEATSSASRRGSSSNSNSVLRSSNEANRSASVPNSPVTKPIPSPQSPPAQESTQNTRFFRFRFGTSASSASASTSPNPNSNSASAGAGPSSRPQTPPASAAGAARRPLDAIRERDPAHLTSASLPSLVADTTKREHELETALAAERARYEKVASEKKTLEAEVEGLSQALFEEANRMVAQERMKCADIEEELRQVRQEKEALKSAMRIVEQENTRLRGPVPVPGQSSSETLAPTSVAAASAEEDEPTPRTSRPTTPRNRDGDGNSEKKSISTSSTPRSSISDQKQCTKRESSLSSSSSSSSSMRAIHERSSTPGSGLRSPSLPPLESERNQLPLVSVSSDTHHHQRQSSSSSSSSSSAPIPKPEPESEPRAGINEDSSDKLDSSPHPTTDADAESDSIKFGSRSGEREGEGEGERERESQSSNSAAMKSSFDTMPAAESPWSKI